jgi:hypothetical protein
VSSIIFFLRLEVLTNDFDSLSSFIRANKKTALYFKLHKLKLEVVSSFAVQTILIQALE